MELDARLRQVCIGLLPNTQHFLLELSDDEDKELIADFIDDWANQGRGVKMPPNSKKAYIDSLVYLSRYVKKYRNGGQYKRFADMTREDVYLGYLNSLKRGDEDPDEKWINTYRKRAGCYRAFFKYLNQRGSNNPIRHAEDRPLPHQLDGLTWPKRKRKTSTKDEDLWTSEEHKMFMTYCEDLRLKCFHEMQRDTGVRPGELVGLKIGDIHMGKSRATGKSYAEFWIEAKSNKMRQGRWHNLSQSLPIFNKWVAVHPQRNRPHDETYLFPALVKGSDNRKSKPLEESSVRLLYARVILEHFKEVLEWPHVPEEHKVIIRRMQKKPFYPYLRRHEYSSENAPTMNDYMFNELLGHAPGSNVRQVYMHEFGKRAVKEDLVRKGILTREETLTQEDVERQPKYCPMCQTANDHDDKFCINCNFILSQQGLFEVKEEDEKRAREAERVQKELQEQYQGLQKEVEFLKQYSFKSANPLGTLYHMLRDVVEDKIGHEKWEMHMKESLPEAEFERLKQLEMDTIKRIKEGPKSEKEYQQELETWHQQKKREDDK